MDFRTARAAMVESQIRPNNVRDTDVLNAFATTPRELFVPESQKPLAYIDEALPIEPVKAGGEARYLLPPMILARLLQFGGPYPVDKALDVGCVTGYSAAILSKLCGGVVALEASEALAGRMQDFLKSAQVGSVRVESGPLNAGFAASKPYDLILLNGFAAKEPESLFAQMAEGGRLLALIGSRWCGQAYVYTKSDGIVSGRAIFDASGEVLPGFEAQPHFVF